jgi:hypothetical protein
MQPCTAQINATFCVICQVFAKQYPGLITLTCYAQLSAKTVSTDTGRVMGWIFKPSPFSRALMALGEP